MPIHHVFHAQLVTGRQQWGLGWPATVQRVCQGHFLTLAVRRCSQRVRCAIQGNIPALDRLYAIIVHQAKSCNHYNMQIQETYDFQYKHVASTLDEHLNAACTAIKTYVCPCSTPPSEHLRSCAHAAHQL